MKLKSVLAAVGVRSVLYEVVQLAVALLDRLRQRSSKGKGFWKVRWDLVTVGGGFWLQ